MPARGYRRDEGESPQRVRYRTNAARTARHRRAPFELGTTLAHPDRTGDGQNETVRDRVTGGKRKLAKRLAPRVQQALVIWRLRQRIADQRRGLLGRSASSGSATPIANYGPVRSLPNGSKRSARPAFAPHTDDDMSPWP